MRQQGLLTIIHLLINCLGIVLLQLHLLNKQCSVLVSLDSMTSLSKNPAVLKPAMLSTAQTPSEEQTGYPETAIQEEGLIGIQNVIVES